jgi:hypothetical protein
MLGGKHEGQRMSGVDKIVAAILTVACSSKDTGIVNPADFVRAYENMLAELDKQKSAAAKASNFASDLEKAIRKTPQERSS